MRIVKLLFLSLLVGLKLEQQQKIISSHYFSKKFKISTLQEYERYMEYLGLEMYNLRIEIFQKCLISKDLQIISKKADTILISVYSSCIAENFKAIL